MVVLSSNGAQVLARVQVQAQSDGQILTNLNGQEEVRDIFKTLAEEANKIPREIAIEEQVAQIQDAFAAEFRSAGYLVQILPAGDVELKFEMDLTTGRSVGRQTALHKYAEPIGDIGRAMQKSLDNMFIQDRDELTQAITRDLKVGSHEEAGQAILNARAGFAFRVPPDLALLDALEQVNVTRLSSEAGRIVLWCRIHTATRLGKYDSAGRDAESLLERLTELEHSERANLLNVRAMAAADRGDVESALSIWRDLTKTADGLDAKLRGWTWRNYSKALNVHDPEARRAARLAADAFLEAGEKREAASSLMHLSHLLEHDSPEEAIQQLDDMLNIMSQSGVLGDELRASIFHIKGGKYLALGSNSLGFAAAKEAVNLRRGVTGAEGSLVSSLHLAATFADSLNDPQAAELEREAEELDAEIKSPRFEVARRIERLGEQFDRAEADSLLEYVKVLDEPELHAGAEVIVATTDPSLTAGAKLQRLESVLRVLDERSVQPAGKQPAMLAIAYVLRDEKEFQRAAVWIRRALDSNPMDLAVGPLLVDTLWQAEDWGGAAIFLRKEIDRLGSKPGLLAAYGRSLLEAGDLDAAVRAFTQALKVVDGDGAGKAYLEKLRNQALDLGGTSGKPSIGPTETAPVLRGEVEQALKDFARFIAADKRMRFWTKDEDGDYEWVSHPEQRAQDLLHTFLKARFQDRISVFEEVGAGAGRLDLILRFSGGLSAICELKMCGFGYSSTYAAEGNDQICHYMENRNVHLGYLVVHDARLNGYAQPLRAAAEDGADTVEEIFVDVRPRVSARSRPASPDKEPE
jgi:tetratricopeptide (TPR) repeat protein